MATLTSPACHSHLAGPAGENLLRTDEIGVEVISSMEEFRELRKEWDQLVAGSVTPNVFLTWQWLSTWWECFGEGFPWIVVARNRATGELVGGAPFTFRRQLLLKTGTVREISFMGCTVAAPDHLDIVAKKGHQNKVAEAVLQALINRRSRWDVLRMDGMLSDSLLVERLRNHRGRRARMVWESICPFIMLPKSWDDYLGGLDRKVRYNLRSRAKRLEADSAQPVRYLTVSCADELQPALDELFRLHQGRRVRGEPGAFGDPQKMRFHRRIAEKFLHDGRLRLSTLKVGDETLAAIYCFRYQDTIYFYQTGFDHQWSKYGPGAAIIAYAIRASIEEGAHEFDFLRGSESYKAQWNPELRRDLKLRMAGTLRGSALVRAYRLAWTAREKLKSMRGGKGA